MKNLYFLLILFVLLDFKIPFVTSQLTSAQKNFLNNLTTVCSISWNSGSPSCGGYDPSTQTRILCDTQGLVNSITLDIPTGCNISSQGSYNYDQFNLFPNLLYLSTIKIGMKEAFDSIQTHPKIQNLQYIGDDGNRLYFPFSTNFNMPSLQNMEFYWPIGTLPTNINVNLTKFHIYGPDSGKLHTHFPVEQLNPSKTTFYYVVFELPTNFQGIPNNVFSLAPNLQSFQLAITKDFTLPFQNFKNPPSSLTDLGFYSMPTTPTTVPDIVSMGWGKIQSITLMNLGLTGSVPAEYFAKHIKFLNFNLNSNLNVGLSLVGSSGISSLDISYTGSTGTVPGNILDGGLANLNAEHTSLSGNLPPAILCLPNIALQQNYKFDTFTNYNGPTQPRVCKPVITSIEPETISTSDFYFTLKGTSLGSTSNYFKISMNTQSESIVLSGLCVATNVSTVIQCINPNIQGNGTLYFTAVSDQTPASSTSFGFQYTLPTIQYVSPVPTLGGDVTIYGNNLPGIHNINTSISIQCPTTTFTCYPNQMKLVAPNSIIVCPIPAGIESNCLVIVYVKQIINDYNNSPRFFYKSPSVKSTVYIKPNTDAALTISGQDFWNDTSMVGVKIDDYDCNVTYVNHNVIYCDFPKIPFSPGYKSILVSVAEQSSLPNSLFSMVDPGYCPSFCSNGGSCDPNLGFCMCQNGFAGPSCEQKTMETDSSFDSDLPILEIDNDDPDTTLYAQLTSVNQNGQSMDLTDSSYWSSDDTDDNQTEYTFNKDSVKINVIIRKNIDAGSESFGGSTLSFPNESYSYKVTYQSSQPVNNLYFGFNIQMDPLECEPPPYAFSYPTASNGFGPSHYLTLLKYNAQWHARFPLITVLNGGKSYATISTEPVNLYGNSTQLNAHVQSEKVSSAEFQYDFTLLSSSSNRVPVTKGCEVEVKKSNNGWKIGVGVGVPLGVALLAGAGFLIFKQQRKLNSTKRLLDQKLSELSRYN